ncbi:MAG: protein-export chaperone SecB [Bauldia sp.]
MADISNDGRLGGPAGPQGNFGILAQYVKDLSFESPGAPQSLRNRNSAPNINIGVNVQAKPLQQQGEVEVELRINAQAVEGTATLFAIELIYAGVFRLTNFPEEALRPITYVECPRFLFPFARQIVSDASRNGGFPPLMIDPIDFAAMYQQRAAEPPQGRPTLQS